MVDGDKEHLRDEALVLHVRDYQTADKYVVCFTKKHGKLRFIAYGARYVKNVQGRLLQPFARLEIEVQEGRKVDKLRSCELVELPRKLDMTQMAYAAVAAELLAVFTEDREPQAELYELFAQTLATLTQRNPRLSVLAFAIKLLDLAGFAPQMQRCANCAKEIFPSDAAWFSPLQGGLLCEECRQKYVGAGLEECTESARNLWQRLAALDFEHPAAFSVRGGALMELEKILCKFIFYQTDKPLNSLNFLSQLKL